MWNSRVEVLVTAIFFHPPSPGEDEEELIEENEICNRINKAPAILDCRNTSLSLSQYCQQYFQ